MTDRVKTNEEYPGPCWKHMENDPYCDNCKEIAHRLDIKKAKAELEAKLADAARREAEVTAERNTEIARRATLEAEMKDLLNDELHENLKLLDKLGIDKATIGEGGKTAMVLINEKIDALKAERDMLIEEHAEFAQELQMEYESRIGSLVAEKKYDAEVTANAMKLCDEKNLANLELREQTAKLNDEVWRLRTYYDDLARSAGEKQRELEEEVRRLKENR